MLETQFQRPEERRADIVVKVSEENRNYLLHTEIQKNNDSDMPNRMIAILEAEPEGGVWYGY